MNDKPRKVEAEIMPEQSGYGLLRQQSSDIEHMFKADWSQRTEAEEPEEQNKCTECGWTGSRSECYADGRWKCPKCGSIYIEKVREGMEERIFSSTLPVVGDTVEIRDQPGQTFTVLYVHDADRSVDLSNGLTVPFQYILIVGDEKAKSPMGGAKQGPGGLGEMQGLGESAVRMAPLSVLPMMPGGLGTNYLEQEDKHCPECKNKGYRLEAAANEIYYNHGRGWHGPFTEAEDEESPSEVVCPDCGKNPCECGTDNTDAEGFRRNESLTERKAMISKCAKCGDEGEEVVVRGSPHEGSYHRHADGSFHGPHPVQKNEGFIRKAGKAALTLGAMAGAAAIGANRQGVGHSIASAGRKLGDMGRKPLTAPGGNMGRKLARGYGVQAGRAIGSVGRRIAGESRDGFLTQEDLKISDPEGDENIAVGSTPEGGWEAEIEPKEGEREEARLTERPIDAETRTTCDQCGREFEGDPGPERTISMGGPSWDTRRHPKALKRAGWHMKVGRYGEEEILCPNCKPEDTGEDESLQVNSQTIAEAIRQVSQELREMRADDDDCEEAADWIVNRLFEISPPGWSGTISAMKKHMPTGTAFKRAWAMYHKGAKPHYKPEAGHPGAQHVSHRPA